MKRNLSFVAIVAAVLTLTIGMHSAYASGKDKVDLNGNWTLWIISSSNQYWLSFLNTDVEGNPTYVLKQDGANLTGTGGGVFGTMSVQGVIKGDELVLKGIIGNMDAHLTGTYENNWISGKMIVGFDEADFVMKRK